MEEGYNTLTIVSCYSLLFYSAINGVVSNKA